MWNRALATVLYTFCRPRLPKVLRARQFFNILKWKSSSHYSPAHFSSSIFLDRRQQPRKQRPFTWKNTRFLRARVFSRVPDHSSQLLDDGWLTWWDSVTRKCSNLNFLWSCLSLFVWLPRGNQTYRQWKVHVQQTTFDTGRYVPSLSQWSPKYIPIVSPYIHALLLVKPPFHSYTTT